MYLLGPDGPVRVVKVEEAGVYDVHDITVEDDHSYVSCGVFSHNSCNDPNLQNIPRRRS
jgi:intein/homing endonuclease